MKEQRAYQRLSAGGQVRCAMESPGTDFNAQLENVSFGGFGMYTRDDKAGSLQMNNVVAFELAPAVLGEPVFGKGRIRYINPLGQVSVNPETSEAAVSVSESRARAVSLRIGVEFIDVNKDMITYLINRLQLRISEEMKRQRRVQPIDFIPY